MRPAVVVNSRCSRGGDVKTTAATAAPAKSWRCSVPANASAAASTATIAPMPYTPTHGGPGWPGVGLGAAGVVDAVADGPAAAAAVSPGGPP